MRRRIVKQKGRSRYFEEQEKMQAWLFVEDLKARNGWSTRKACLRGALTYHVLGRGSSSRDHSIGRETLRSVYYAAMRVLAAEREEHEAFIASLRAAGASIQLKHDPLPIATFWNHLLQERLRAS